MQRTSHGPWERTAERGEGGSQEWVGMKEGTVLGSRGWGRPDE